jgi:dTDP-glucose 4,6-dehydratase
MNKKSILITGGAGFIGSHVVRLFVNQYPQYHIVNFDALTYAGNLASIQDVESKDNYTFVKGDITKEEQIDQVFQQYHISHIIHLAAESHVDRSILDPMSFIHTNVLGTAQLLNAAKKYWKDNEDHLFYHVSTDEVFGSLGKDGKFNEDTPYNPHSPYSASKAASDHLVRSYGDTYRLPFVISNCSNNYGSHQFPEKLIPVIIQNIIHQQPLPIYGKGDNVRDWLWVEDHARAIDCIFHQGNQGETYCIGGNNEWNNLELVELICELTDAILERPQGEAKSRIQFVEDRKGHDFRYAIDASKLERTLNWHPTQDFKKALQETILWYINNNDWVQAVKSGDYQKYYAANYGHRI